MASASKKSLHAAEQDRPDVAQAREQWKASQTTLDPKKLVFVDETGTNTKMVRGYGRCRRGQRLIGKQPWGHWKTTTFTAGLRCDGISAPWVLDGPMNRDAFLTYVEMVLAPATLVFLPPYSPDLNPIEMLFAKLKALLRKAAARTRDTLWDKIGEVLAAFSAQECQNYFRHAGYAST
jgi:transposase